MKYVVIAVLVLAVVGIVTLRWAQDVFAYQLWTAKEKSEYEDIQ
jgi:hypothetical protein